MLDWLIIGGGIHGTYLSNLLVHQAGVDRDAIRVLDPHSRPLAVWRGNTANCGMQYLRSPSAHNIDINVTSVYKFAKTKDGRPFADFIDPYYRPSLALFNRHCDWTISRRGLETLKIRGRAMTLKRGRAGIVVETDTAGELEARHIILAIGLAEQPCWPQWAREARNEGGKVTHLFDPDFQRSDLSGSDRTLVVGAGISGLQVALAVSREQNRPVTLISQHAIRTSPFDFDPCWIGPKCMTRFVKTPLSDRRNVIDAVRQPGTASQDVITAAKTAMKQGTLEFQQTCISGAAVKSDGIQLACDGTTATQSWDYIILATGFEGRRPGGAFIDQVITEFGLKTATCGYPVPGKDLRWHEHIFVTGPLSELQLGPCARNIVGARNAGRRILSLFQPGHFE